MKWTIILIIIFAAIAAGMTSWLAEPMSGQAFTGQLDSRGKLQTNSTPTPSVTPSPTATPEPSQNLQTNEPGDYIIFSQQIFIPLIRKDAVPTPTPTPRPAKEFLVCSSPWKAIPDGSITGLRADITLPDEGVITDLDVYVRITHPYVGDLAVELNQRSTGLFTVLLDRPGLSNSALTPKVSESLGCEGDNVRTIFDSQAEQFAENKCQTNNILGIAIGGIYKAQNGLEVFNGQPAAGTYSLLVADLSTYDSGTLDKWCVHGWTADSYTATPTPAPLSLPASAQISGVTGQHQALPLDCEIRSAVDWAKFFKVTIDEMEFFSGLPESDNPDKGFVGNVNGTWGQVPPSDYGVHAWPIAARLRAYGLTASAKRGMSFDELRAEIAGGRPVEVWIAGNVQGSAPEYYQAQSDSGISIVARYEHTVIVYGYNSSSVSVLNGANQQSIPLGQFLDSWSALGNMAVVAKP